MQLITWQTAMTNTTAAAGISFAGRGVITTAQEKGRTGAETTGVTGK